MIILKFTGAFCAHHLQLNAIEFGSAYTNLIRLAYLRIGCCYSVRLTRSVVQYN
jgi:hypothetical protein